MIGVALGIFFAVAGSWIIKAGFIKYFTKVSYQKAIRVSVCMNLASGIFGIVQAVITYISMCIILYLFDDKGFWFIVRIFNIKVNTDTGEALFFTAILILAIISAVFINPLIEGFIVKLMLKLKIKKTYKWLLGASVLSVAICFLLIFVMN
ncbi:MAG: hypothetical protein IJA14_03550 [Alphaproteobacteria bacterium]|nr:hypothetical protein [Alphaproteobacteria bacterium]